MPSLTERSPVRKTSSRWCIAHDTKEIDQQYILDEINIMLDTEYTGCPKGAKQ